MSAHLGFIHYWLYNKIRLVAEREEMIYQKAAETCSSVAEELQAQIWGTYGEPQQPDADLADLIDPGNIHGWLQRQINAAETREAALVKGLIDICGDTAAAITQEAFAEHGRKCGQHALQQEKYVTAQADGIYKAFTDYFLNGMPCDQNTAVVLNTPERLVWEGQGCSKLQNWSRAGIEAPVMRSFYLEWIKGFVEGVNPAYTHRLIADTFAGEQANRHEIVKR